MIISAIRRSKHRDRIRLILIGEGPLKEELQAIVNVCRAKMDSQAKLTLADQTGQAV
jgi:hypothetical protein